MEKLFELLRSKLHWLLLFLCEIIALLLLFHGSFFHSFIGAAASSTVVGHFNERMARIRSYLALQEENEALLTQLVEMESRYLRSEEHTSELQSRQYLVCRLLLEKKKHTCYYFASALH